MNRFRFYTIVLLAVLFTVAAIFWHRSHLGTNITIGKTVSTTETPTNFAPSKIVSSTSGQAAASPNDRLAQMGITPEMTESQKVQKYAEWYVKEAANISDQHHHPIELYGETVDESNQPVAGVNAHLILTESPASPNGIVETNVQSDSQGYFSFTGAVGKLLQVWLNKDGYYVFKSNRIDFDFAGYQPNPNQPEVFHLRKKGPGVDLITSKSGFTPWFDVHVPNDGTPIKADLLNRGTSDNGQIEFSNIKPEYLQAKQATEWSFKMEIPNGGFIEENDEFPFDAPEDGYQPVVQFDFQKGQPNWTWNLQKDYYIKFGNPPRYGYFHLETSIGAGVRLTYVINPDGSRYLEPK